MGLEHLAMYRGSLELNPLWADRPACSATGDRHDPGEAGIHQHGGFFLVG